MRLILFRHALAERREDFLDGPDSERPLADKGRARMKRAARGLALLEPSLDAIATSPYARAAETAALLGRHFGVEPTPVDALLPGRLPEDLAAWLLSLEDAEVVAAVGHEPDLGLFASWFLAGLSTSFAPLRKAAALAVDFSGEVGPGEARLVFAVPGRTLRSLGGR